MADTLHGRTLTPVKLINLLDCHYYFYALMSETVRNISHKESGEKYLLCYALHHSNDSYNLQNTSNKPHLIKNVAIYGMVLHIPSVPFLFPFSPLRSFLQC
jgi:hypothetical protein